jgi:hypothetical protein
MNRRQQLATIHETLLDVFGHGLGRAAIGLFDLMAAHEDAFDDVVGRVVRVEVEEPLGEAFDPDLP